LFFYILTIAGVFRLRSTRPDAERPYRAWGYPWLTGIYIAGASVILVTLFVYRSGTTWPGIIIVAAGVPVYYLVRRTLHGQSGILSSRQSSDQKKVPPKGYLMEDIRHH